MSSTGAKSLITDNLVINNVFAVQDDGTPQTGGKVLVTDSNGLMTYEDYNGAGLWYKVTAAQNVNMGGNTIYNCPNMVSEITTSPPITGGNCINISLPSNDDSGNRSYNITTNITAGSGIDITGNGLGGIQIINTDSGSVWYTVPAEGTVDFTGNTLENTGTISGSGGIIDLSGSININGPISNSSGLVQINDNLDLSGNNIQGVNGVTASGTITANNLNFTGNLQNNGTNITNIVQSITSGNGSGITVTGGTTANPTISTNLIAGSNITFIQSTIDSSITIDVSGGGASQWITTGDNISYTGGNVGINNVSPIAPLDIDSGSINSGAQYFKLPGSYNITIPGDAEIMYYEIIGGGPSSGTGNGGYAIGSFNVSMYKNNIYQITVSNGGGSNSSSIQNWTSGITQSIIAYDGSGNTNGSVVPSDSSITIFNQYSGQPLPSYLLQEYGRAGQAGLVYISFSQPSIRAVGDIISGGAITGESLNIKGNADISGYIYTNTTLLANILYSPDITGSDTSDCTINPLPSFSYDISGSVQISSLISGNPYTSGYVRVKLFAVGGGAGGTGGSTTGGGGGGGSAQELSGIYYVPVTSYISYSIGSGGGGGSVGGNGLSGEPTTVDISGYNIYLKAYGAESTPNTGAGGNGYYGGGGCGKSISGEIGGLSYSSVYPSIPTISLYTPSYQYSTGANGTNNGGNGDGPGSNGGAGGSGNLSAQIYGGGGGASSSIANGGNGASYNSSSGNNGIFGSGGGGGPGGPGGQGTGGSGGSGAIWIQIFSV